MEISILKPLCYFDVFNHPLKREELLQLCDKTIKGSNFDQTLKTLVKKKVCFESNNYYSINRNVDKIVKERKEKEALAQSYLKKLPFYTRIIKSFPFVRGVSISGSLSKGVMYDKGDIDYFIVTKKNRLWVCRTLLILFKKICLLNSRKYFCVNYFVDEDNTEILDQNIFTAIEITHLIPVYGADVVQRMKAKNDWTKQFFPNHSAQNYFLPIEGSGLFKRTAESLFSGGFAEKLDLYLMKITHRRWSKKFKSFHPDKLELTMRSNRGISKHHPSDFQTKVLAGYKKRIEKLTIGNEGPIYS